jgi:hypothetical protein
MDWNLSGDVVRATPEEIELARFLVSKDMEWE